MKTQRNKSLPILMYHEVATEEEIKKMCHKMTPSYFLFKDEFSLQIKIIDKKNFQPRIFEDIFADNVGPNSIFITFDDGWMGNHDHACQVLNEYGFKATFFVTVDYIGKTGYMDWKELNNLISYGMSVQSHCLTHKPLQTLNQKEIYTELVVSKNTIEDKLGVGVIALSFPHGSYSPGIINMADEIGYKVMCTSNLQYNYLSKFNKKPLVLGRITVSSNITPERFTRLISYDFFVTARAIISKKIKNLVKKVIGIENYRKLYRKIFGIVLEN
jgi:peptidoglycan/xylan/chitin deacetylase (PgdA/CDA1 family)